MNDFERVETILLFGLLGGIFGIVVIAAFHLIMATIDAVLS